MLKTMKSQRIRLFLYSAGVGLCLFLVLQKTILPGGSQRSSGKGFDLLGSVIRLVRNDYIEERDPVRTMEGAYKGLVDSLDPVSSYLNKDVAAKHLDRSGDWAQTGITLFKEVYNGFPLVAGIIEGSPAEKAGVKTGDVISAIDGNGTLSMSSLEANLALRSRESRPVVLKVLRDSRALDLTVTSVNLDSEAVKLSSEKTYSILSVRRLLPSCSQRVKKEFVPLLKSRKHPLVLDLRNCSEGDMDEACRFLNIFVQSKNLGAFEKKGGVKEALSCPAKPDLPFLPIAVWINLATTGPAELIAASLQETKKVKIIGLETPGLVSKQEAYKLEDGSVLFLTSGVFTLASGKKLWETGVVPDEKIDFTRQDLEVFKAKTLTLLPPQR